MKNFARIDLLSEALKTLMIKIYYTGVCEFLFSLDMKFL